MALNGVEPWLERWSSAEAEPWPVSLRGVTPSSFVNGTFMIGGVPCTRLATSISRAGQPALSDRSPGLELGDRAEHLGVQNAVSRQDVAAS